MRALRLAVHPQPLSNSIDELQAARKAARTNSRPRARIIPLILLTPSSSPTTTTTATTAMARITTTAVLLVLAPPILMMVVTMVVMVVLLLTPGPHHITRLQRLDKRRWQWLNLMPPGAPNRSREGHTPTMTASSATGTGLVVPMVQVFVVGWRGQL